MILVTGGAGFIGSHTCVELVKNGYEIVIVDNFCNSSAAVINNISKIIGSHIICVEADVNNKELLDAVFNQYNIQAVIHFAGYKAVYESVKNPLTYYRNNVDSTLAICEIMEKRNVKKMLFSSSATVYDSDNPMPLDEEATLGCTNPYGWTKRIIEQILKDLCSADDEWSAVSLRYFNPVGAHKSGLIGELPKGVPNNLMPYITQVASGKLERLRVFGNDYSTLDGTGVRDYVHVVDIAKGHVNALEYLLENVGAQAINLGTGKGYSVLEVIHAFEVATGIKIPYEIVDRRPGDIAQCYAKINKAKELIGWHAELGIEQMCADAWNFQRKCL